MTSIYSEHFFEEAKLSFSVFISLLFTGIIAQSIEKQTAITPILSILNFASDMRSEKFAQRTHNSFCRFKPSFCRFKPV